MSQEEYKAITLNYKWMFVDMITPDDTEKSFLGVSISRPNNSSGGSGGWCKPKPISIGEVKIANDETHFMLDVSFMMYMRSNIFSSNFECTFYFYVHSLNFHIDDIISVQSMIFCIIYIFTPNILLLQKSFYQFSHIFGNSLFLCYLISSVVSVFHHRF